MMFIKESNEFNKIDEIIFEVDRKIAISRIPKKKRNFLSIFLRHQIQTFKNNKYSIKNKNNN